MINDATLCRKVYTDLLQNHHVYVQGINFPTVPKGQERLRITANPYHTEQMVSDFVNALCTVLTKYDVYDLMHKKISFG